MKTLMMIVLVLGVSQAGWAESAKTAGKGKAKATKAAGNNTNKKVTYRKTQEVNFDGSDIDGQVRTPDGAYLLQKRGVQFMPLYKVNDQFEKNILDSVEFLR